MLSSLKLSDDPYKNETKRQKHENPNFCHSHVKSVQPEHLVVCLKPSQDKCDVFFIQ